MALSDIVNVTISSTSAKVTRAGYGVPMILAPDTTSWDDAERVRFYTSQEGVATDFATTTATYKMAARIFAQANPPPRIAVGKLANKPTQRWAITPTVANSTIYQMEFNGNLIEYTSDASATAAEIIAGLKADIDALALDVTVSDQTTYMRIVANTAGTFFTCNVLNYNRLAIAQDHADPGVAADLNAIALQDSTWYTILNAFNSKAMADVIIDWAETAEKLFLCQTQDSAVITLALGSDTGGSETVAKQAMDFYRTAVIYHPETDAFADAAWAGACLPLDPGSETWAFKTLAGVSTYELTATQRTNLVNKRANFYEINAGISMTNQGKVGANEWIDIIRFRDWVKSQIQEDVVAALANSKKIPFTDAGIAAIKGLVLAVLRRGIEAGGLSPDPAPVVTAPKAADVSAQDKAARTLSGVKADATLAGAIQVTNISVTLAV